MKTAIQFGAGNIGRGFMGQLLWEAGMHTCFVENNKELVDALNAAGTYPLRLLDAYSKEERNLTIDRISACSPEDAGEVSEAFAQADIASTAVGIKPLEHIAPLIAQGIQLRKQKERGPIDIYLCENAWGAGEILRNHVMSYLNDQQKKWAEEHIGFVGTSVARMVPAPDARFAGEGKLFVAADAYCKLPYDKTRQKAQTPPIPGMKGVENLEAEFARKLYTHNLGHAAMGYIGYLKGYTYVHEALEDPSLEELFDNALHETSQALFKMFPRHITEEEHQEVLKDVKIRFSNPMIMDSLVRVARDPIRKLGRQDRLAGSAELCMNFGIEPEYISYICGAAYHYDDPGDPGALQLQQIIQSTGIEGALQQVSGIDPAGSFGKAVISAYKNISRQRRSWETAKRE